MERNNIGDIFIRVGVSSMLLSIAIFLYLQYLFYRNTCVVCGTSPPCLNTSHCLPNSAEGMFWHYMR